MNSATTLEQDSMLFETVGIPTSDLVIRTHHEYLNDLHDLRCAGSRRHPSPGSNCFSCVGTAGLR